MTIYQEIIEWSKNQYNFIQDAIRRLLLNPVLTDDDYNEIYELLKKEAGFSSTANPIIPTENDIPTNSENTDDIKLLNIENPINITALYNQANLNFNPSGLTIVYGKNGSGKSSYSKILKKCCWSKDKNVHLSTNIFSPRSDPQSVRINYSKNGQELSFTWNNDTNNCSALNQIYIFDSRCANLYVNNENPSEYKPSGIEILEKLIIVCNKLTQKITDELAQFNSIKPEFPSELIQTSLYNWYSTYENNSRVDIEKKLQITQEQIDRFNTLKQGLATNNPEIINNFLTQKVSRYSSLKTTLETLINNFNEDSIKQFEILRNDYITKQNAYIQAQESFKGNDIIQNIGSESWKLLWKAATEFIKTSIQDDFPLYPKTNINICPLCQQTLTQDAEKRFERFNKFILDKTNSEFVQINQKLISTISYLSDLNLNIDQNTYSELCNDNILFSDLINIFKQKFESSKNSVIKFLRMEINDLQVSIDTNLQTELSKIIDSIKIQITSNIDLINNRNKLEKEFSELSALLFISNNRDKLLSFKDNFDICKKLAICNQMLPKRNISMKIGDILESKAIEIQQNAFIDYLIQLNPAIASKIAIKKTKTTNGNTYQKCKFNSSDLEIADILSEGEQKIVALANFLSECTLASSKNTIVFDDPVTSLDQDYREQIAKIIINLSNERQIIVLSHDLYFIRLLKDKYKEEYNNECFIIGLRNYNGISGIVSDEIPYLAKNVQERIDTIRKVLKDINALDITRISEKEEKIITLKDYMRQLLERTVEDVLVNKTVTRFSKNINFKRANLNNIVTVTKNDIDFLLRLYGRYSEMIHDGSPELVATPLTEIEISRDLQDYETWKKEFIERTKTIG